MADTTGGYLSVQGDVSAPATVYSVDMRKASGVANGHIGVIMADWSAYVSALLELTSGQDESGALTAQASGVGYYNSPAQGIANRPVLLSIAAARTVAGNSTVAVRVVDWHTGEVLYAGEEQTMTRGGVAIVPEQGPAAA